MCKCQFQQAVWDCLTRLRNDLGDRHAVSDWCHLKRDFLFLINSRGSNRHNPNCRFRSGSLNFLHTRTVRPESRIDPAMPELHRETKSISGLLAAARGGQDERFAALLAVGAGPDQSAWPQDGRHCCRNAISDRGTQQDPGAYQGAVNLREQ